MTPQELEKLAKELEAWGSEHMAAHDAINDFIRGKSPSQRTPAPAGISPEKEERILKYIALGESYQVARDLVLNAPQPDPVPSGQAGNGTGGQPSAKNDMNSIIRQMAGKG